MGLVSLISSVLGTSASLGASANVLALQTAKYLVQREIASEIGPLATLIPMRGFNRAISKQFNAAYAKSLPKQVASIAKPEVSKPVLFNSLIPK